MSNILNYYSRNDIKRAILNSAKNREVSFKFGDKGFGRRPDIIQFENDVFELAKQGVTSFHISEELWSNPLLLKAGMSRKELDELRIGWDLVLDLDGADLELSRIAALIIVDALDYYGISTPNIKFSGNKGFHIVLPHSSFPKRVNDIELKLMFPELSRSIANFIKNMIKEPLSKNILEKYTLNELELKYNVKREELQNTNGFNPFSLIDIDSVLISSRHMIRAPYSINEKSNLVSIPVSVQQLKNFDKNTALPENVEVNKQFFNTEGIIEDKTRQLFIQVLDWQIKQKTHEEKRPFVKYQNSVKISDKFFPDCIKKILDGIKSDGRKRALFILITFLRKSNYSYEDIEPLLYEWNKKNYSPLPQNYIRSQVNWHKRQKQDIMPPNCDNAAYYSALGVKCSYCDKFRNPLNYALRMSQQHIYLKRKSKKT